MIPKPALEIKSILKQFKKVTFQIKRDNEVLTKEIVMLEPELGIVFESKVQKLTFQESLQYGFLSIVDLCKRMFEGLFSFMGLKNVGGIVSIVATSRAQFQHGLQAFLTFVSVFSVNLGFINLLPVPVLDGGNVVIGIYEVIMGKRIKKSIYQKIMMMGAWILLFFFVVGFMNDFLLSFVNHFKIGKRLSRCKT